MTRPADALRACRAAADRSDAPAVVIAWVIVITGWGLTGALVLFGAVGGVAIVLERLMGLGLSASCVTAVAVVGLWGLWTGWLATAGRRPW